MSHVAKNKALDTIIYYHFLLIFFSHHDLALKLVFVFENIPLYNLFHTFTSACLLIGYGHYTKDIV